MPVCYPFFNDPHAPAAAKGAAKAAAPRAAVGQRLRRTHRWPWAAALVALVAALLAACASYVALRSVMLRPLVLRSPRNMLPPSGGASTAGVVTRVTRVLRYCAQHALFGSSRSTETCPA